MFTVNFPKPNKLSHKPKFETEQRLPTRANSIDGKLSIGAGFPDNVTLIMVDERYAGDTHLNEKRHIVGLIVQYRNGEDGLGVRQYIKDKALATKIFDYEGFHDGCNKDCCQD